MFVLSRLASKLWSRHLEAKGSLLANRLVICTSCGCSSSLACSLSIGGSSDLQLGHFLIFSSCLRYISPCYSSCNQIFEYK